MTQSRGRVSSEREVARQPESAPPPLEWKDVSLTGGQYSHLCPPVSLVVAMAGLTFFFAHRLVAVLRDDSTSPVPDMRNVVGSQPLVFGLVRFIFAVIVSLLIRALILQEKIKRMTLTYFPESKLVVTMPEIRGLFRLSSFTTQNWTLIGIYFAVTSAVSLLEAAGVSVVCPSLSLGLWIMFQVCLANAMLVTTIVTFYLIPLYMKIQKKAAADNNCPMESPIPVLGVINTLMHTLNTFFMLSELLMNKLSVNMNHIPAAGLWGLWYVFFSWIYMRQSGVVFYNFLDSTLPASKSILFHIGLLAYLSLWFAIVYAVRAGVDLLMEHFGLWTWVVVHGASVPLLKVDFANMKLDYKNWNKWLIP